MHGLVLHGDSTTTTHKVTVRVQDSWYENHRLDSMKSNMRSNFLRTANVLA